MFHFSLYSLILGYIFRLKQFPTVEIHLNDIMQYIFNVVLSPYFQSVKEIGLKSKTLWFFFPSLLSFLPFSSFPFSFLPSLTFSFLFLCLPKQFSPEAIRQDTAIEVSMVKIMMARLGGGGRVSIQGWPEWDIRALTGSYIKFDPRFIIELNVRSGITKLLDNNTKEYFISLEYGNIS